MKESALTRNLEIILKYAFAFVSAGITFLLAYYQPLAVIDDVITRFVYLNNPLLDDRNSIVLGAPANFKVAAIMFAITIFLGYMSINRRKIFVNIIVHMIELIVFFSVAIYFESIGIYIRLLVPAIGLIVNFSLYIAQNYIINYAERVRVTKTLKMYVDPKVAAKIAETRIGGISKLSSRRSISVLFVDIRGFTSLSEVLEPEQVVEILNEYLGHIAKAVAHWGGTLDKFIGDAAMAVFNSPDDLDDYVLRSVCAALEITDGSEKIRTKYQNKYGKSVGFGVGINCGDAVVGNIGSIKRMDFTAIGDTVNTASRLEGQAKAGQILVSQAVIDALAGRISYTDNGPMSLKGKALPVMTYQIDGILDDVENLKMDAESLDEKLQAKLMESQEKMEEAKEEIEKRSKEAKNLLHTKNQ